MNTAPIFNTIISAAQLHELRQSHDVFLIDARHDLMNPDAGCAAHSHAHIPNAHFMHMDNDLSGIKTGSNGRHPLPDLTVLTQKLCDLGLNNNSQVVIYDANNGMMAARAWWLLRHLGHGAVAVLDGGLAAWESAGFAVNDNMSSHVSSGSFKRSASLNTTVDADELMNDLAQTTRIFKVIDARAPERFSGQVEPIDPVGGHIPHAVNQFFMHNLTNDLTFKSPEALREIWLNVIGEHPIENTVNQCGSGVTACHNILAQHIAGIYGAALYAGSWSEWCSDAMRPVTTNV